MENPARKFDKEAGEVKPKKLVRTTLGDLIAAVAEQVGEDDSQVVALTVVDLLARRVKTTRPVQIMFEETEDRSIA